MSDTKLDERLQKGHMKITDKAMEPENKIHTNNSIITSVTWNQ